jgi:hypothetical protein
MRFDVPVLRLIRYALIPGLLSATISGASPILTFDPASGLSGINQDQSVGWQFNVVTPVTITGLGWYDQTGNGLPIPHIVGLWAPDGTLLVSLLVDAGTTDPLDGQFRTAAIQPLSLTAGTGYIIGGENFATNTERLAGNVTQTVDARIRYLDPTFSVVGSGFIRPTLMSLVSTGVYGPSFSVSTVAPVPEPSSIALFEAGVLVGTMIALRKRTRDTRS